MLYPIGISGVYWLLSLGCRISLFPFEWDPKLKKVRLGSKIHRRWFTLQKYMAFSITIFCAVRLHQGLNRTDYKFPIAQKILTIVWLLAYVFNSIAFMQFEAKELEIVQFVNCLLNYIRDNIRDGWKNGRGRGPTLYILIAIAMLIANPFVHVMYVYELPCTPHFISSAFLPCEGFHINYWELPLHHIVPFMMIEFYNTGVIFFLIPFNGSFIYLGMSWLVLELKKIRSDLKENIVPEIVKYRFLQCVVTLMNYSFVVYLSAFPSFLFAIVAVLIFGFIRIWRENPGSNLMYPLCGVRCGYDAIAPLAVAGDVNDLNKEVLRMWKKCTNKDAKLGRAYRRSAKLYCKAGSLYSFESSIVLCCLDNCIKLTLDMFLTFD